MILSISIHTCQCAISAAYVPSYIITIYSLHRRVCSVYEDCSVRYVHSHIRYTLLLLLPNTTRGINKPKWWPKNTFPCASVYLFLRVRKEWFEWARETYAQIKYVTTEICVQIKHTISFIALHCVLPFSLLEAIRFRVCEREPNARM